MFYLLGLSDNLFIIIYYGRLIKIMLLYFFDKTVSISKE